MTATTTPLSEKAIRELPSGRELDSLVSRLVMGHTTIIGPEITETWPPYHSLDIAAAMQVAEKLVADGWNFEAAVTPSRKDDEIATAVFEKPREGKLHYSEAPMLPLAVCRSALLTTLEEPCDNTP